MHFSSGCPKMVETSAIREAKEAAGNNFDDLLQRLLSQKRIEP